MFDSLSCKVVSLNVLVLMYWATLHMNIFFFSYNPPKLSYCMSMNLLCLYVIIIVSHTQEAIIGKFYFYILSSLPLYFFFLVQIWERVKQTMLNTHACLQTFVLLKWFSRFSRWTFAIFVVTRRKYKINFIL